jgi:hypothetical protein
MNFRWTKPAELFQKNAQVRDRSRGRINNYERFHHAYCGTGPHVRALLCFCSWPFAEFRQVVHEMASKKLKLGNGFRISNDAVIRLTEDRRPHDRGQIVDLPHVYGAPILFAIARDPHTIFAYWEIDWPTVFATSTPVDRQVHVRLLRGGETEETSVAVEPLAGSCYLAVPSRDAAYRIEIGYYLPENSWNSLATSEEVIMPPDEVSDDQDVDFTTIPFHLSFQRLIDLFRASSTNALSEIISRLQNRAVTEDEYALLSEEEWEILRAMNLSLDEMRSSRRAFLTQPDKGALRKRAEAILGFGATSPTHGFEASSW